ncbi:MAG TPA: zf-HC2 domain-containing protein [Ramlibacter sp.]|nr:zf-HC2 domain-containing protein [Ramlibacter sp.]
MILRRTCKQAAALMVAREDRPLRWNDEVALRLHLAACRACPTFERQLQLMRRAFARWREHDPADPPH